MNRLFWGLLFCFVDIDLTLGTAVFELLPDFVGFFLVMKGMEELSGQNRFFDRGRHMAFALMLAHGIFWAADLLDPELSTRVIFWGMELGAMIAFLVLLRWVVRGIGEMAQRKTETDPLRTIWLVMAVMYPVCHLLGWVPLLGTVCVIGELVPGLCFMAALLREKKQMGNTAE